MPEKYIAEVKENDDSKALHPKRDKEGSIQIYVESLMHDILDTTALPWARQDKLVSSDIPEIGDKVWVWWEDETHWRNPFYGNKVNLKLYNEHKKFEDIIKNSLGAEGNYPNIKYNIYKNCICIGVCSDPLCPEVFIYHPFGSFYINKLGKLELLSTTGTEIKSGGVTEPMTLGTTLTTYINTAIVAIFNAHTHLYQAPLYPLPGGIVPTTVPPTTMTTGNYLSPKNKND